MKIVLLAEAQRRFEAEDEWWRENRDSKELFVEEFERTLAPLRSMPGVGKRYRSVLTRSRRARRGDRRSSSATVRSIA